MPLIAAGWALALVFAQAGVPSAGSGGAPCRAERERAWTTDTLSDWVSFSDQLSVIRVISERQLDPPQSGGYVGRRVAVRVERTFWRRPGAPTAPKRLSIVDWGWCETPTGRAPMLVDGVTRLQVGRRYLAPLVRYRGWSALDDGRLLLRAGRVVGGVDAGSPTFAHQELLGLPVGLAAGLARHTTPYRAAVRRAAQDPVRRWNAVDRDDYRLVGRRSRPSVPVVMGTTSRSLWKVYARSGRRPHRACVGLQERPLRRLRPASSSEGCGPRPTRKTVVVPGFTTSRHGTFVYGSAIEAVASVELSFTHGAPARAPTKPSQAGLRGHDRYWAIPLDGQREAVTLSALNRNGRLLHERRFPVAVPLHAPTLPTGTSRVPWNNSLLVGVVDRRMPAHDAIRGEILRIADRDLDRYDFAREAARVLRRAVPFDAVVAVWLDPETGLPVDEWIDDSLAGGAGSRLPAIGLHETDITAFRQLAASGRRAASMSEATGGTLDRSRRPGGLGDELRVVRFDDSGTWAGFVIYRERGAPDFARREVDLIASLNDRCLDLERVRLQQDLSSDVGDGDPGLLLLDDQDGVEMANPAADAWLDELRSRRRRLPVVVTAVARRAREIASGDSDLTATARARTAAGRWVFVRGWVLRNGTAARTAITLEPARAPELGELLAEAYGLTARERRVSKLVAEGLPNAAIAARLYLSTYTVQDHLKAIFEKLDVSNRGQLVARLFLDSRFTPELGSARPTGRG